MSTAAIAGKFMDHYIGSSETATQALALQIGKIHAMQGAGSVYDLLIELLSQKTITTAMIIEVLPEGEELSTTGLGDRLMHYIFNAIDAERKFTRKEAFSCLKQLISSELYFEYDFDKYIEENEVVHTQLEAIKNKAFNLSSSPEGRIQRSLSSPDNWTKV
jgi:hypothetical protein